MKNKPKNTIKKALSLVLSTLIVLSFISCKGNPNSTLNHSLKEVSEANPDANINLNPDTNIDKYLGSDTKDIVVFSTNDTLGAYNENLSSAGIKYFIDNFDRKENYVTFVDTGNFMGNSEIAKKSKGKSSIEIMNAMGYEIVVPGTHEFDYGVDTFLENIEELKATVVCCNILDIKKEALAFMPYVIYQYGNTKVAYVGVTSPEVMYNDDNYEKFLDENKEPLYYFFEDRTGDALYNQVQLAVDTAREEGANKVILLAHLGIEGAEPIWSSTAVIARTNGIDGVVDGHSMEVLESGLMTNKNGSFVPLVQAGSKYSNLGVMNVTKDGYNFPAILSEKSIGEKDTNVQNLVDEIVKKYSN